MQYSLYMHKKLEEISHITSGYTFRGSITKNSDGDVFVVQAKNLISNQDFDKISALTAISSTGIRNPYFLQHNDILIVSRGSGTGSFRSAVFVSSEKNIIASSSVHIVRVTDVTVLPKYISLYLNSPEGQKAISQIVTGGSYLQSLLIKNLADLQIPIPPMHVQKSLVALHENVMEQRKILERKIELQNNIINATFTELES